MNRVLEHRRALQVWGKRGEEVKRKGRGEDHSRKKIWARDWSCTIVCTNLQVCCDMLQNRRKVHRTDYEMLNSLEEKAQKKTDKRKCARECTGGQPSSYWPRRCARYCNPIGRGASYCNVNVFNDIHSETRTCLFFLGYKATSFLPPSEKRTMSSKWEKKYKQHGTTDRRTCCSIVAPKHETRDEYASLANTIVAQVNPLFSSCRFEIWYLHNISTELHTKKTASLFGIDNAEFL